MYSLIKNLKVIDFVNEIENSLSNEFSKIEKIYEFNQMKVLNSFIDMKISESHFFESTGYGYSDNGRDIIENLYSKIFNTEDSLVRQQIVSGTHAISLCLFALTKPYDEILSITGIPYDTIKATLGIDNNNYSLKSYNINFNYVDLINNCFDYDKIKNNINSNTKIVLIQRSRGYSSHNALSITQIKEAIEFIKNINSKIIIMIDNCYGEFVDELEPTDVGADIMCGSLIKNPGGSLAKSGGYIVGKKDLIEICSYRLTAPGLGKEVGISFNQNRNVLQGMYLAPQIVYNSLKINKLFSKSFDEFGFNTIPKYNTKQNDIVLSISFNDENKLKLFCEAIQSTSPVDSYIKPLSSTMPGYNHNIIMAAGNFISGSSIELSCDAPMTPPYTAFLQGGITYYQGKLALMKSIESLNLIK